MANALLHKVEVVESYTVETLDQLQVALKELGSGDELNLSHSYRIELLSETLSDGSVAHEINIRKAEAV